MPVCEASGQVEGAEYVRETGLATSKVAAPNLQWVHCSWQGQAKGPQSQACAPLPRPGSLLPSSRSYPKVGRLKGRGPTGAGLTGHKGGKGALMKGGTGTAVGSVPGEALGAPSKNGGLGPWSFSSETKL